MQYETKRFMSFLIVGGYLFLGGCEYAVILPTCFSYLKTLGAKNDYWFGFTVSAYSLSAAISGIIGGRLSDLYEHQTKNIALVSIILMIFGSLQYTVGYSVWNIIISRLICGCGTAAGSAMLAEVCRVTAIEERTPILAICNATRQLGILVGPVFQLILTYFHFEIFSLEVNPLNAAGVFMAGLWLVFSIMTYFMFYNLSTELKTMRRQQRRAQMGTPAVTVQHAGNNRPIQIVAGTRPMAQPQAYSPDEPKTPDAGPSAHQVLAQRAVDWEASVQASGSTTIENSVLCSTTTRRQRLMTSISERLMSSLAQSGHKSIAGQVSLLDASGFTLAPADTGYMREFLTDYFVLMLSMVFTLFFCQVGIETIVPVVMQEYFGYTEFENSLVYMAGGAEALIVFFSVAVISRYVRDTNLMIIGWVTLTIAHVWLMIFLPQFQAAGTGSVLEIAIFMIGLILMYFGYAVSSVANTGLFSKCLSPHTQGLGQGLRRGVSYMGLIFGPTWAGATVKKPYRFLGIPLGIVCLHAMMLIASFRDLRDVENEHRPPTPPRRPPPIREDDEERPLLR